MKIEKRNPEGQNTPGPESQASAKVKQKRKKRINMKKLYSIMLKTIHERGMYLSTSLDEAKKNEDCNLLISLAHEEGIHIPDEAIEQLSKVINSITYKYYIEPAIEEVKSKYGSQ